MKKRYLAIMILIVIILSGCGAKNNQSEEK